VTAGASIQTPQARQIDPQMVARLLGGGQSAVTVSLADSVASRFKLSGVVAARNKGGYAVISVDGKPARPYRVGTPVNDGLVLHSVAARSAALAASVDAPVSFTLELPKPGAP
jgi:general secretion pathway protein C